MANKEKEYEIDEDFLLASIGDHKEGKSLLKKEEAITDDEPVKPKDSSVNSKRNKRSSNKC